MVRRPFPSSLAVLAAVVPFVALAACGSDPPPPPAAPPTPAPVASAPPKVEVCGSKEACVAEGKDRFSKGNIPGSRESYARGCHLGDLAACTLGGALYLELPADTGRAESLLAHACGDGKGDADGCAMLLAVHVDGKTTPPEEMLHEAAAACVPGSEDPRMKRARGEACAIAGHSYERGVGTEPNEPRAVAAYKRGCELGHDPSCRLARELSAAIERKKEAEKPSLLPGANMKVSGLSGQGMTLDELACKTEGVAGMFGPLALMGAFGPKKAKLDACAKAKTEIVLRWSTKNGAMSDVKAEGAAPAVNACVERVMTGSKVIPGACAARFSLRR